MSNLPVPLYARLPEIYRQRDIEQLPPGQLQAYLALIEQAFSAVHDNIGLLYRDLFIETCSPWVIPYIGDLLGVSALSGEPWTLRADVADTVELRPIPQHQSYDYAVVNQRRVIVDPQTRRVVRIVETEDDGD